jgi:hypothetical protein
VEFRQEPGVCFKTILWGESYLMQCLVCGEEIERDKSWDHIQAVHLKPIGLTQEQVFEHARKTAHPIALKTASVTCINLKKKIIYFSLDNAELLIAFAYQHGNIPWMEVVEWQILHEVGHIKCKDQFEPPRACSAHILASAEDYYINRHLIPEKYWRVCIANARCSTVIRNVSPMPYDLRNGYYYSTLATFLAYDAVTLADFGFLQPTEVRFVEIISDLFRKIEEVKEIPVVANEIDGAFEQLFPPKGTSWDSWQI